MSRSSYTEITVPKSYALLNMQKIATDFLGKPEQAEPFQLSDFKVKEREDHTVTFAFASLKYPATRSTYDFFIDNEIPFLATYSPYGETPAGSIYGTFDEGSMDYGVEEISESPVLHIGELAFFTQPDLFHKEKLCGQARLQRAILKVLHCAAIFFSILTAGHMQ